MGLMRTLRRSVTLASLGLAGGAVVVATRHLLETPQPLESLLPGEGAIDRKHGGDIYYNVAGPVEAEPLVLLHDFYPGASNFEYRRIFGQLAERYRVYAPDWLGFGMSEHPNVAYTGEFYAGVLAGFLRDVVTRPSVVLAHGHAANIAVRAASDNPALFDRLVLASPAVFAGLRSDPTFPQALVRTAQRLSLGLLPYALLATRPALRRIWSSRSAGEESVRPEAAEEDVWHLYASAHQFGGQHASLALLTGELDLPMQNAFALLEPPVLLVGGERDQRHSRVDLEDIAVLNPHADLTLVPGAGDAVFVDQPEAFVRAVTAWLAMPASRHTLDESAFLGAADEGDADDLDAGASASASAQNRIQGQMETGEAAQSVLPETPTEGGTAPLDVDAAAPEEDDDEGAVGTPGYTVPGVSDMGLDGPSTPDVGGITALGGPSVTLGPADVPGEDADDGEPSALLPEAGEAEPEDSAEHAARLGLDPPLEPADNIGVSESDEAPEHDTRTSDSSVQTPPDALAAGDDAARTARAALDTDEMIAPGKEVSGSRAQPARPTQQTRRAPGGSSDSPAPRAQPRSRSNAENRKRSRSVPAGKDRPRPKRPGPQPGR
jgi:pimeloyl-ACP methyl ester carboxylesterase